MNNLRKFDAAGRMVELPEGSTAAVGCSECVKRGVVCRVSLTRVDKTCAYCKRMGRSGCTAVKEVEEEEDVPAAASTTTAGDSQRLAAIEQQLAAVNA